MCKGCPQCHPHNDDLLRFCHIAQRVNLVLNFNSFCFDDKLCLLVAHTAAGGGGAASSEASGDAAQRQMSWLYYLYSWPTRDHSPIICAEHCRGIELQNHAHLLASSALHQFVDLRPHRLQ